MSEQRDAEALDNLYRDLDKIEKVVESVAKEKWRKSSLHLSRNQSDKDLEHMLEKKRYNKYSKWACPD